MYRSSLSWAVHTAIVSVVLFAIAGPPASAAPILALDPADEIDGTVSEQTDWQREQAAQLIDQIQVKRI